MLQQTSFRLRRAAAALAVGLVALSCGGGAERQSVSGPAPVAVQPGTADDGDGSVSEAAQPRTAICHYDATTQTWKDLSVPAPAVSAHLKHGDVEGSCAPACPCFSPADLVASTCSNPVGACGQRAGQHSLLLNCPASGNQWEVIALVDGDTCYLYRIETPNAPVAFAAGLTPTQVAACTQLLVTNQYYEPGTGWSSCPS